MGVNVFANGMEVSCKSGDGKVIAAFPDVCLSPPTPPAGPVPIPYPLNSMASDTSGGSKSVKVGGKEAMLKDKSYFKKSTGDEAATKTLGQGVINHSLGGKVYFVVWSMDVQFEGENVVRHLDMTTSNHASPIANQAVPWVQVAAMLFGPGGPCEGMDDLKLQPYKKACPKKKGKKQTGHHLIPGRCMRNIPNYNHDNAPVICASYGNQHQGSHKACHAKFDPVELDHHDKGKKFKYSSARKAAASSAGGASDPPRDLSEDEKNCVALQLDAYYKDKKKGPGCTEGTELRTSGAAGKVVPSKLPGVTT